MQLSDSPGFSQSMAGIQNEEAMPTARRMGMKNTMFSKAKGGKFPKRRGRKTSKAKRLAKKLY